MAPSDVTTKVLIAPSANSDPQLFLFAAPSPLILAPIRKNSTGQPVQRKLSLSRKRPLSVNKLTRAICSLHWPILCWFCVLFVQWRITVQSRKGSLQGCLKQHFIQLSGLLFPVNVKNLLFCAVQLFEVTDQAERSSQNVSLPKDASLPKFAQ